MRPALQWSIPGRGVSNINGLLGQRRCCPTEKYFKIGELTLDSNCPAKGCWRGFFVRMIFAMSIHAKSLVSIIFDRQLRIFIKYFVLF